ncbi:MAG: hypothetical protein Q7R58_02025 [bacterium]|nr:hypothetical protein [bacterium]
MRTKLLSFSILGFGLALSTMIIANGAFAQTAADDVQYPVAELGGCGDKDACRVYCDVSSHLNACLAFAEKNNLMSEDEIDTAKKFMEAGGKGPGGCTGKDECQNYCDSLDHIDECIAFAEKTGILPPDELVEAKQVQSAIARGVKPPACRGKKECDAYCEDPGNMKVCIAFGEESGFLKGRELEDAKKMLVAIENGVTPPPCRGREACEAYCSEPDHMEACMTFARAAGFMTEEEAQNSEKMMAAIKKGVKPPQCRGKEACDSYCLEPVHTDECIQFAVVAGFMTEEEAEMSKKTGGKGPGGCTGKDSCETFCGNPDNQESCINFAKENGMISEEDAERMQIGPPQGRQGEPRDGQEQGRMPLQGERPDAQFMQRIEPDQMSPEGYQQYQQQYQQQYREQYQEQYQQQYQPTQFVPGTEPVVPPSGELIPPPIESAAPQSFNVDLSNALATIIIAFKKIGF